MSIVWAIIGKVECSNFGPVGPWNSSVLYFIFYLISLCRAKQVDNFTLLIFYVKKTSVALAIESSGYACLRNPCDPSWFATFPCEVGVELENILAPFLLRFFVHSLYTCPLFNTQESSFCHNFLISTHRWTYRRANKRPEYIYGVYSRRSTTFVFRCSPNSWFLTIFDIFSRDRQRDRQTDRPTDRHG